MTAILARADQPAECLGKPGANDLVVVGRASSRSAPRPVQEFFSIGEVCALTDLQPHVLRYWESQFRFLSPSKNRSGNRVYKSREVELILLVKHLLFATGRALRDLGAGPPVDRGRQHDTP